MLKLQPIAKKQQSYFQDTFALLKLLKDLPPLPPNASFFTCNAKSMYTNIDTDVALALIANYLRQHEKEFKTYHTKSLIAAMNLVFRNNILSFGDAFLRQLVGEQPWEYLLHLPMPPSSLPSMKAPSSHVGHNKYCFTNALLMTF